MDVVLYRHLVAKFGYRPHSRRWQAQIEMQALPIGIAIHVCDFTSILNRYSLEQTRISTDASTANFTEDRTCLT